MGLLSTQIRPAVKKFSGKPLGIASKFIGAAAAASVLYDAHKRGTAKAVCEDELNTAERVSRQLNQRNTMDGNSETVAKMKNMWYDMQQKFPFYHFGSKIKGYTKGFGQTIVQDLPIIALSAVSLKCKNLGKAAGCVLGALGIKTALYDVAGIGKKSDNRTIF